MTNVPVDTRFQHGYGAYWNDTISMEDKDIATYKEYVKMVMTLSLMDIWEEDITNLGRKIQQALLLHF